MTKINSYIFYSLFLSLLLLSACSGQKKVINIKDPNVVSDDGSEIDQSKRVNFMVVQTYHEAIKAKTIGDNTEAINLFREVLKMDAGNHAAMYELAQLLLDADKFSEAANYARQALKLNPSNEWYQKLNAEILAYEGKFSEAAKVFVTLIEKSPGEPEYYFDLAYLYERAKNYKESIKVYDQIEDMIGIEESVILQKQKLYLKLNDIPGAAAEIQKLIDYNPSDSRYYGILAEMYESNDMMDKALEIYNQLIKNDPENPYAAIALANFYQNKGDKENYWNYIQKAFKNPTLSIDIKVGYLLNFMDKLDKDEIKRKEALVLSAYLIEAHPENAKSYAMYADILYNTGKQEEALAQYRKSLEYNNSIFTVWQQMMFINADLQRYDSLEVLSEESIELFPNQAMAYFFNGVAKVQLKKYQSAINMLNQALLIGSNNKQLMAEVYANLGEAYNGLKNYAESDSSYEKSIELNPNNAFVLNNYSYYLSLRGANLDRAEAVALQANKLIPDNSAFQDTYAWVLYKRGKFEMAKEWLEKALKNGGDSRPVILEHYGDVLFKIGDVESAVEYWQKSQKIGGDSEMLQRKINNRQLYE